MGKRLEIIDVNERNVPKQSGMTLEEKRRRRQRIRARQLAIKRRRRKRILRLAAAGIAIVGLTIVVSRLNIWTEKEDAAGSKNTIEASSDQSVKEESRIEELLYEVE